ncbi:Zinc finger CCCH domain-containing protein 59 [Vitis vinifera]|uniref:Zinc finger CCCH domain-containing protein 59 n=1 Tax=Vitis vinifera TaxID=29760 RepID=A0A438J8N7_VITVI|nr:Zinc finger CCCH domain-containing protein 59 [Vitis vinifera]
MCCKKLHPSVQWSGKVVLCNSYHIAGTKGIFYDREPYSNLDAVHVTRFLGLAPVGNKDKQVLILILY